jgi:hypothetical protein
MANGMPKTLHKISIIWVLIAVFILKEVLWVAVIPPREAPDELGHYGYIESLFYENDLPLLGQARFSERVQVAGTESAALCDNTTYRPTGQVNWIAQHPPFYYLLLLPVFSVLPHDNVPFSIFILRFVSVLLGAVTLFFAWKTLERINPPDGRGGANSMVNIAIVGAIAFLPMFSYASAVMNNDNLIAALAAVLVYLLTLCCDDICGGKKPSRAASARHAFFVGLTLGILALTKTTSLPLFAVVFAVFLMRFFTTARFTSARGAKWYNSGKAQALLDVLIAFGVPLLFAGWWYARNFMVFGTFLPELKDAVALNPYLLTENPSLVMLFPEVAPHADTAVSFWDFLFVKGFAVEYFKNIWGAFGRYFVQLSVWQYLPVGLFTLVGLYGCIVSAFIGRAKKAAARSRSRMVLLLVLVIYIAAITWKIYEITVDRGFLSAMHGRYFMPALLPFFYFFIKGWEYVLPPRMRSWAFAAMLCLFIANDISALLYVVIPALY